MASGACWAAARTTAKGGAMNKVDLAEPAEDTEVGLLRRCGALRFGQFKLSSGKITDYYFDSKEVTLEPEAAKFVVDQLGQKLEDEAVEFVGGPGYSAIPLISQICLYSCRPGCKPIRAFYVRQDTKGHGLDKLVEGKLPPVGGEVAILDDVVTSGRSLLDAVHKIEEQGYTVHKTFALLDRGEGGREKIEGQGYSFWALFTVRRDPSGQLEIAFNGI